jgi:hypothetical protein
MAKAALVGQGARTSPLGTLGMLGVGNLGHSFHGEETMD